MGEEEEERRRRRRRRRKKKKKKKELAVRVLTPSQPVQFSQGEDEEEINTCPLNFYKCKKVISCD